MLLARGAFAWTLGHVDIAAEFVSHSLKFAEQIDDLRLLQWTHYWTAIVIFDRSEFEEASCLILEGAEIAKRAGQPRGAAWCVFYLAQIARVRGHVEETIRLYKESLEVLRELDVFGAGWCCIHLGHLATKQGDFDQAHHYLTRSLEIYEELSNTRGSGGTERGLGLVELERGNLKLAEQHVSRSRVLFNQLGWIKMATSSEIYLGFIATLTGRVEVASELLLKSLVHQDREGDQHSLAHLLMALGLLAGKLGHQEAARVLTRAARDIQEELEIALPPHLEKALRGLEWRSENSSSNRSAAGLLGGMRPADPGSSSQVGGGCLPIGLIRRVRPLQDQGSEGPAPNCRSKGISDSRQQSGG